MREVEHHRLFSHNGRWWLSSMEWQDACQSLTLAQKSVGMPRLNRVKLLLKQTVIRIDLSNLSRRNRYFWPITGALCFVTQRYVLGFFVQ